MPRLCLIKPSVCPPDGFRYVDPVDGYISHGWTYDAWVEQAKGHFQINNRPVPATIQADMEEQLCKALPPGWCLYDDPNRPRPSTALSWNDVMAGVATFGRWIAQGAHYVPQAEAERRATICTRCYLNVNVSGCLGCQKAVQEIVRDKKTKHDDMLRTCAVCKCFLRAKVHFPISALDTTNAPVQEMYPDFCWLNKQSDNYRG
jgi:hypothetical protein